LQTVDKALIAKFQLRFIESKQFSAPALASCAKLVYHKESIDLPIYHPKIRSAVSGTDQNKRKLGIYYE
jgi:hypothetical protein